MPENGENGAETLAEVGEEIAETVAEAVAEETAVDTPATSDIDVTVNEAVEVPETSYVDVGDLHISGPPEMVERITRRYLDDHIDHNPHGENHGTVEELGQAITPDPVEELIADTAVGETVDAPPVATDWLFKPLGGQR